MSIKIGITLNVRSLIRVYDSSTKWYLSCVLYSFTVKSPMFIEIFNLVYMQYKVFKSKSRGFRTIIYYTSTKLEYTLNVWWTSNYEPKRYARVQYIFRQMWKYCASSNIKKDICPISFLFQKALWLWFYSNAAFSLFL